MLMWRLSANLMSNGVSLASKARQHWLWYAYNTKTGGVLAYTFGPRTDETCRELLALLTPFNIGMLTSDDWGSYGREGAEG
ncbi:Transposase [Shigella dysenteriae 1617]|uniref:Transposase n=1 Tax=Shigella dysenteriae 1617 TaxID=754093 RepID=A0A0A7A3M9_SHIDY|nr:Transposase [Shigella dysenteriae 1617]